MFEFADCWGNQGHKDHILSREVSTRERPIITHTQHGGVPCNYSATEEKKSCSDAYDGVEVLLLWLENQNSTVLFSSPFYRCVITKR